MRVEFDDAEDVLNAFSELSDREKEKFIKNFLAVDYVDLDMISNMVSSLSKEEKQEILEDSKLFDYQDKKDIYDFLDKLPLTCYSDVKDWVKENAKYHFE